MHQQQESSNQKIYSRGVNAEKLIAQKLEESNWHVLRRNYRTRGSEIDIIATKGKTLVAVEVKYRSQSSRIDLQSLVSKAKISRLKKGLWYFISQERHQYETLRIDFALVTSAKGKNHFEYWPGIEA